MEAASSSLLIYPNDLIMTDSWFLFINKDCLFTVNSFLLHLAMLVRKPSIACINSNDFSVNSMLKEK